MTNQKATHLIKKLFFNTEETTIVQGKLFEFSQLLAGLAALAKKNIAHRDLHRGNILVESIPNTHLKRAVIADFGLAIPEAGKTNLSFDVECLGYEIKSFIEELPHQEFPSQIKQLVHKMIHKQVNADQAFMVLYKHLDDYHRNLLVSLGELPFTPKELSAAI